MKLMLYIYSYTRPGATSISGNTFPMCNNADNNKRHCVTITGSLEYNSKRHCVTITGSLEDNNKRHCVTITGSLEE